MTNHETGTTEPKSFFDKEQFLVAGHVLSEAQTDIYSKLRDYARNSLLSADQLRQDFPEEVTALEIAADTLQDTIVAGNYWKTGYYSDGDSDVKQIVPFGSRLSWRMTKQFTGVLRGLEAPTLHIFKGVEPMRRLVYVIDPISTLPGQEHNYRPEQLQHPFADSWNPGGRVYVPVDFVEQINSDGAYLNRQGVDPRFLGRIANLEAPENND